VSGKGGQWQLVQHGPGFSPWSGQLILSQDYGAHALKVIFWTVKMA